MIILLSPSKTIKNNPKVNNEASTQPIFLKEASKIIDQLNKKTTNELQTILKTSYNLANQAKDYHQLWKNKHTTLNSTQAIFAFQGDVYTAIEASTMDHNTLLYSGNHLCILSGIYGMLSPLNLIQPYRLDVANKLEINSAYLYTYWKTKITNQLLNQIKNQNHHHIVNLASLEYFNLVNSKTLYCPIVTPIFKDNIAGTYKIVSVFAKKARGNMSRYILENKIEDPKQLKSYNEGGYLFDHDASTETYFIYKRG